MNRDDAIEEIEINEADELRREDRAARVDAYYDELDRKDRAGPHWIYR